MRVLGLAHKVDLVVLAAHLLLLMGVALMVSARFAGRRERLLHEVAAALAELRVLERRSLRDVFD